MKILRVETELGNERQNSEKSFITLRPGPKVIKKFSKHRLRHLIGQTLSQNVTNKILRFETEL
jgi:hypothetical protein